ncbi:hypothetical protein [Shimia ponticola]|uniref:hypothetical protein n=1 Tax=Shimia ponticola TaxID=2582893 RepID=UPI00164ADC21|nr:hypothetical protein [Shimia ponticola]
MRKLLNKGIDKGFDMATGAGRRRQNGGQGGQGGHGVSEEDRAEMQAMKQRKKNTKQAMKVGRRIGKL